MTVAQFAARQPHRYNSGFRNPSKKATAMALWAIGYDLDVKGMRDAGYTKGNVTTFYNSVRACLADNNFEKFHQLSLYTSDKPNSVTDAYMVCLALATVTDADKFISGSICCGLMT